MRRQMPDDRVTQPAKGSTEVFLENNSRSESIMNRDDNGFITAYPGSGSIETSVSNSPGSQSGNTVFIWDVGDGPTFTLRYANPAFLRLLGKTPEEVLGKSPDDVVPHDTPGVMHSRLAECACQQLETEFVHEQFGCMLITRLCPQVEAGRTIRLIGTITDITENIREQKRLMAINEQLRQQALLLSARIKFESLIARALCDFMDAGSAGFDSSLTSLNQQFGAMMGSDQAFILQRYSDNLFIHKARWTRNGGWLGPGIGHICSVYDNNNGLSHLSRLLVINDTQHERLSPFSKELQHFGVRALLAIPICRDTFAYGLLCLAQTTGPRVWTTAEISMAKTAADIIMSAYLRTRLENGLYENVRILTEYDEALQDLLAQKEIMAEISGTFLHAGMHDFDDCATGALKDIGQMLSLDALRAVLRTEDGLDTFGWQECGLPRRIGRECGRLNETALHAAALRAPVAIDNTAEAHVLPELAKAAAEEGVRSLLVVPLYSTEGTVGAIMGLKVIGVKAWTPSDISCMEAFARIFTDAYRMQHTQDGVIRKPPQVN